MASRKTEVEAPKRRGRAPGTPVISALIEDLDYENTASDDDFVDNRNGHRNGPWYQKLVQLKQATLAGKVEPGSDGLPGYVKLARFNSAGTAQVTAKDFEKNPEKVPGGGAWDFRTRRIDVDGVTKSEIWGRFVEGEDDDEE